MKCHRAIRECCFYEKTEISRNMGFAKPLLIIKTNINYKETDKKCSKAKNIF